MVSPTDIDIGGNPAIATDDRTLMQDGLTNQFHLDGDATDSIGNNDGTLNGNPTTVPGRDGDALSFDEDDDYVVIPDVQMNDAFTVSFQFKIDDTTGSLFQYIYSHGNINDTNSLNIFINEASHGSDPNVLRTVIRDTDDALDNTALQFDISGIVGDGQWHTYTLVVNASGSTVYLDGAEQNNSTAGGDAFNPSGDVYLGAREDLNADRMYGGELDTVQIYDRPLTATEVNEVHTMTGPSIAAGTVVADVTDVIDADNAGGHTFALTDDAGGKFVIDATSGAVSLAGDHDASVPYSDTITIEVTDPDFNTYSETLGITIGSDDAGDTSTGPHTQNVMYGLAGDDSLTGGTGDDVIDGGGDSDTLEGGAGDDSIDGGAGDDSLTGGDGDDVFVVSSGHDTITDFNTGNTGTLFDGDSTNNDFINLSGHYDHISELFADQADDGVLNQSNDGVDGVDYSDNDQFGPSNSLTFQGAAADGSSFSTENTGVVCFSSGTAIRTPRGDVLIDGLRVGDLVTTLDNGPQRIRWISRRTFSEMELIKTPNARPVLFKKGISGADRDLFVSQQHGMLVARNGIHLARAKHLAGGLPGVCICNSIRKITYIHLMFDAHQIIFAENIPSESFYPGPMALAAIPSSAKRELAAFFPELNRRLLTRNRIVQSYGGTARTFLGNRAAKNLTWAHSLVEMH